jgi:hypothetical protein
MASIVQTLPFRSRGAWLARRDAERWRGPPARGKVGTGEAWRQDRILPMRAPFAALVAGSFAAFATPLQAQDTIDAAILDRVAEIAATGYADPDAAVVSGVRKSLARNGMGYCGDVTIEDGDGVTLFHVLLETAGGPSVLRLADYPESDMSPNAQTVRQLMKNFGCAE